MKLYLLGLHPLIRKLVSDRRVCTFSCIHQKVQLYHCILEKSKMKKLNYVTMPVSFCYINLDFDNRSWFSELPYSQISSLELFCWWVQYSDPDSGVQNINLSFFLDRILSGSSSCVLGDLLDALHIRKCVYLLSCAKIFLRATIFSTHSPG